MKLSKKFAGSLFIVAMLFLWLVVSTTKETEETDDGPLRTIVFNQCEKYPDEDISEDIPISLRATPGAKITFEDDKILPCENLSIDVLEEKELDGQVWLHVKNEEKEGWVIIEVFE